MLSVSMFQTLRADWLRAYECSTAYRAMGRLVA